jgi:hypothetical protein
MNYHVMGGLFLRGNEWSEPPRVKGQPVGQIPYWDFLNGYEIGVDTTFIFHLINFSGGIASALCVRGSSSQ